jgi:hypothetical protein
MMVGASALTFQSVKMSLVGGTNIHNRVFEPFVRNGQEWSVAITEVSRLPWSHANKAA